MKTKIISSLITALCVAVGSSSAGNLNQLLWKNEFSKVLEVIEKHPESALFVNDNGVSPLHIACAKGNLKVAKALIAAGADVEQIDQDNRTTLTKAVSGGNPEIVMLLAKKGVDVTVADKWDNTPLHIAAYGGKQKIAKILLNSGAVINASNSSKQTPLMAAIWSNNVDLATMFVKHGAKLDVLNEEHQTALMMAADRGLSDVVALLLEKGADSSIADSQNQRTALHYASIKGYTKILKALCKNSTVKQSQDARGKTFKDYLAIYSPQEGTEIAQVASAPVSGHSGEAEIIYTGHAGWVVKTQNNILVFDYWKPDQTPDSPSIYNGHLTPEATDGLPVTVFVTHNHGDHYDKKALKSLNAVSDNVSFVYGFEPKKWNKKEKCSDKTCADSKKTKATESQPKAKTKAKKTGSFVVLEPRTEKTMNGMNISTIESIDTGVGFLVEVDGVSIFHAGDHACLSEADKETYFSEIEYLVSKGKKADIAFLPVSGCPVRWKPDAVKQGFFATAKQLQATSVFPMHGLRMEHTYTKFAKAAKEEGCEFKVLCAENPGDHFVYSEGGTLVASK